MPFYIYAWIGAITSGLLVIIVKLTSKHSISNPWLFNFLLAVVTLLFTIPPALIMHVALPNSWWPIILAGIFSTLFNLLYIFSNNNLDVSTFMPLFNFRGIFAVLIGVSFFGEKFSFDKLFFVGIIILAGIFSSLDEKFNPKSFFRMSIAIGLITTLILAISNAFIKAALVNNSLWTTNLWIAIINFILLWPTFPFFKKELKKLNFSHFLPIGIMGILSTIAGFAANKAYGVNLSVSSLIMNMPVSMILAFLFSIFLPKLLEKHTLKIYMIRFVSTGIMIWAAIQLTR